MKALEELKARYCENPEAACAALDVAAMNAEGLRLRTEMARAAQEERCALERRCTQACNLSACCALAFGMQRLVVTALEMSWRALQSNKLLECCIQPAMTVAGSKTTL